MIQKFVTFIETHQLLQKGDKVVVGVSGGADSVCLLHLLNRIKESYELSLFVLHVHHGIRGEQADRDALFAKRLAASMELPFCLVKKEVPTLAKSLGMTEEETGRIVRYEAMESYCEQVGAEKIAVAHHQGDCAETLLFQLFRGSSPRGLAGIPVKRGRIIRPLLGLSREQIERYLAEEGIDFCQDETNSETVYTRNKIRNCLIPYVKKEINEKSVEHIASVAGQMAEWRRYIEKMGAVAGEKMVFRKEDAWCFRISDFEKEDIVIQGEIIRQIMERMVPGMKDIDKKHYDMVFELFGKDSGTKIMLPHKLLVRNVYGEIHFSIEDEEGKADAVYKECQIPSEHIVEDNGVCYKVALTVKKRADLSQEIPEKDYTKWFDYDKIKSGLVLRNPQEGDYFVLNQMGERKKLSRYYVDRKIPREEREHQLVLAEEDHVLWAFPSRISDTFKITSETKNVLVVTKERIST